MCSSPPIVRNSTWGDQKTSLVYYEGDFFLTAHNTQKTEHSAVPLRE